jgi:hypothetical protein
MKNVNIENNPANYYYKLSELDIYGYKINIFFVNMLPDGSPLPIFKEDNSPLIPEEIIIKFAKAFKEEEENIKKEIERGINQMNTIWDYFLKSKICSVIGNIAMRILSDIESDNRHADVYYIIRTDILDEENWKQSDGNSLNIKLIIVPLLREEWKRNS